MTREQQEKIVEIREQYVENCKEYASYGTSSCKFNVFRSKNENDQNITVIFTVVTGLSDYGQPFYETTNILVEPNGNSFNLMDVYPSNDVLGYIQNLEKIN
jgi:hypothetical protein